MNKLLKLKEAIFEIEPKIDLVHTILGFDPRYSGITVSSDGFFMGMRVGDIGYNDFFGKPSEIALKRTAAVYEKLPADLRKVFLGILKSKMIPLSAVGITLGTEDK